MVRRRHVLAMALAGTLGLMPAAPAWAQIYRWTDDRGVPHYSEGIDSVPERFRPGAVPLDLRNTPAPSTPSGAATPARPAAGATTIRFSPGERIVVDGRLNGTTSVRLLVDTGADATTIAPRTLVAAGVSLTQGAVTGQIRGATGGVVDAVRVPVASLEIGEARVGPLQVIAHDVEGSGVDGLLGRDVLDQFSVGIDSATGTLTLAPKK
jgi:predicted aspartyl protease